jgi:hypothetical protein
MTSAKARTPALACSFRMLSLICQLLTLVLGLSLYEPLHQML